MCYMIEIPPCLRQLSHRLYVNNNTVDTNTRYVGIPREHLYDREPDRMKLVFHKELLRLLSYFKRMTISMDLVEYWNSILWSILRDFENQNCVIQHVRP